MKLFCDTDTRVVAEVLCSIAVDFLPALCVDVVEESVPHDTQCGDPAAVQSAVEKEAGWKAGQTQTARQWSIRHKISESWE